jgi:hypothetical protein
MACASGSVRALKARASAPAVKTPKLTENKTAKVLRFIRDLPSIHQHLHYIVARNSPRQMSNCGPSCTYGLHLLTLSPIIFRLGHVVDGKRSDWRKQQLRQSRSARHRRCRSCAVDRAFPRGIAAAGDGKQERARAVRAGHHGTGDDDPRDQTNRVRQRAIR